MKVNIVDPLQIPPDLAARWVRYQQSNPELSSPYFTLQFTQTIATYRPATFVAVIDDGAAFLPFQKEALGFGVGRPVGRPISDYHGFISAADLKVDITKLLRSAGLAGWEFDHVPAGQSSLAPCATALAGSPVVELAKWTDSSSGFREQMSRKLRKLEREIGPVEFDFHSDDTNSFKQCLMWKSEQYDQTGMYNIFSGRNGGWIRSALQRIFDSSDDDFSGSLSVLRANGRVIAAHFGMRSRGTLHFWFPAYDKEFRAYSPGALLLLKMAEAAAAAGLSTIDLGRGDAVYKERVATRTVPLIEGRAIVRPLAFKLLEARKRLNNSIRHIRRPPGASEAPASASV